MAYPSEYDRAYSFTAFQQAQGDDSFPGTQIDNELDNLELSVDEINEFLENGFRADGHIANGLVTWDSLDAALKAKFQSAGAAPGDAVDPAVVYAGPPSGPDALPTFRALASTDLPLFSQGAGLAVPVSMYARALQKPQFEDYGLVQKTAGNLRSITPANGTTPDILVPDHQGTGRGGGGVFRWDPNSADADDNGITFAVDGYVGSGRWKRVFDGNGRVHSKWYGAQGDNATDDTAALQLGIDKAKALGMGYELDIGDYLTGPLKLNGSTWQPTDIAGQQAAVLCFVGNGRSPFLCRLIAKAGAYDGTIKAVLTGRNMGGVLVNGFSIDSNNIADCSFDLRWTGSASGVPGTAAPSCNNEFTSLWSYRAKQVHFDMRQAADTKISSCHCEGGTAPIGIDLRLGGGGIWMDNCFTNTDAKLMLACQNAGLQNCGFFGGVEVTDQSLNYAHFDSVHFYPYTPKRTLTADSLATTSGSADLVITLGPHGLKVGNYIEISGAVDVGGVTASSTINTSYLAPPAARTNAAPHQITVATDTTVTVAMKDAAGDPVLAGSTATGGGTPAIIGRGYAVESNVTGGASGSRMLKFTACWFNDLGPVGQKYFGGRWLGGARFEACRFSAPVESIAGGSTVPYSDPLCYFDLASWAVAGGDGAPPLFKFDGCSFASVGGRPVSTEGQVLVGFEHRMTNTPNSVTELEWPGDIRMRRSSWDKSRFRFGDTGYLWKGADNLLRYYITAGPAPTGDADGSIVHIRQGGAGSPLAAGLNITPAYGGATFYDTTNATFYVALGITSADWVPFQDKGADMASASTVDLSLATGDYVEITGTTTITAFGTAKAGVRKTLRFGSGLTITHNATSLIIPGNANITLSAGNAIDVLSLGSGNWMMTGFSSFGANASFLVAGTMPAARLPVAAITSGTITGITDLAIADGGTGASSAGAALSNIGGQPLDADLTAIAALISAADQLPYATGAGTWALTTLTAAARTVLDDTTVGAMLTTLGGQPLDTDLTAIAALTSAADQSPYATGTGTWAMATVTAVARTLLDDTTIALMLATLTITNATGGTTLGVTNTASGTNATAIGSSNTASNTSTVAIGNSCQATGSVAIAIGNGAVSSGAASVALGQNVSASGGGTFVHGNRATDRGTGGSRAFAGGQFSATGDGQVQEAVFRATTAAATATRLTTDAAAASATNVLVLANNSSYLIVAECIIRDVTTGKTVTYTLGPSMVERGANAAATAVSAGNPVFVAGPASAVPPVLAAIPTLTADTINGGLNISFTPPVANTDTYHAVCYVRSTQVV